MYKEASNRPQVGLCKSPLSALLGILTPLAGKGHCVIRAPWQGQLAVWLDQESKEDQKQVYS